MTRASHHSLAMIGLAIVVALLGYCSMMVGPQGEWGLNLHELSGEQRDALLWTVLFELRLPRTVLAIVVGGSLALSGALLQGMLHNPLAEPGLLGVSSSAGLGAAVVFYSGLALSGPLVLPLGGLIGAAIASGFLLMLSRRTEGALILILAGVAINSIASSLTALVLSLSSNPFATLEIVFWMLGSLADRTLEDAILAGALALPGCVGMIALGRGLAILSLGEAVAASAGLNLARHRALGILCAGVSVGACVAVSGAIGFVGLIVPHLLRPIVHHAPDKLLGVSFLGGAALLLMADLLIRWLAPVANLRIGVVTALLGAPFFLWLLFDLRRKLS